MTDSAKKPIGFATINTATGELKVLPNAPYGKTEVMIFAKDFVNFLMFQNYVLVGNKNPAIKTSLKDASVALNKKYDYFLPLIEDYTLAPLNITFQPYLSLKSFVALNI